MSQAFSDKSVVLQMPDRLAENRSQETNGLQVTSAKAELSIKEIQISKITVSPYQTREIVSEQELEALSHSIKEQGILQPVIVRLITTSGDLSEQYELVAGERRLRAASMAGLDAIPAIVRNLDERSAAEISVIENAQRENLDPIEEANAYKQLTESFKMTQTEVAQIVGKDRSTISNTLRLLQLDQRIQIFIRQGELTAGHGRVLLQLDNRRRFRLAEKAVREKISVHGLEKFVAKSLNKSKANKELSDDEIKIKASLERQENKICDLLNIETAKVALDDEGRKHVKLTFESEAAWRRFMRQLKA